MRDKIRVLFRAASEAACDVCVLSAFGCGAFGNPPEEVARLFREEMRDVAVECVVFCVVDDHNARRRHNPRGNFKVFEEIFAGWGVQ